MLYRRRHYLPSAFSFEKQDDYPKLPAQLKLHCFYEDRRNQNTKRSKLLEHNT